MVEIGDTVIVKRSTSGYISMKSAQSAIGDTVAIHQTKSIKSSSPVVGDIVMVSQKPGGYITSKSGFTLPPSGDTYKRFFSGFGDILYEWLVVQTTSDDTHKKHYLIKRDMNSSTLEITDCTGWDISPSEYTGTTLKTTSWYHRSNIMARDGVVYWVTGYDHNSVYTPPGYQLFNTSSGTFGSWTAYPTGYNWSFTFHLCCDSSYYYSCQTDTISKHKISDNSFIAETPEIVTMSVGRNGSNLFAYDISKNFLEYALDMSLTTNNGIKCNITDYAYQHIYGSPSNGNFVIVGPYTWISAGAQKHLLEDVKKLDLTTLTCVGITPENDVE